MPPKLSDEHRYRILVLIEEEPQISQRELAKRLGISLGKANYCLKALIDKGALKANRFYNSDNKLAYLYALTPSGIKEKARITVQFLKSKMDEYETLHAELAELRRRAAKVTADDPEAARELAALDDGRTTAPAPAQAAVAKARDR